MTVRGSNLEQVLSTQADGSDDWLRLDPTPRTPVVVWCEAHAGLILVGANALLWGAVACGFNSG